MRNVMKKFGSELVRRGVLRTLGAYVAIIWLLAQGMVDLFPAFGLPEWSIRVFLGFAVMATPFVAVLAWKYDLTTKGLLRDRVDVALARGTAQSQAIDPPQRSTRRASHGAGILHVSWLDENGEACRREFMTEFVIGRDYQADIRLRNDCVSRCHTEVQPIGESWQVKDMGSLNGTFVDGEKIDVMQIDSILEISLDRKGPSVRLEVGMADNTLQSTDTTQIPP